MTGSTRARESRRSLEPLVWLLFSAGGMAAALLIPVLLVLFGVVIPLGWVGAPDYAHLQAVLRNPLTMLVLFGLCVLALFHAAHRLRFTLYHGLGLRRGRGALAVLCYGAAVVGSVVAAFLIVRAW